MTFTCMSRKKDRWDKIHGVFFYKRIQNCAVNTIRTNIESAIHLNIEKKEDLPELDLFEYECSHCHC